MPVTEFRQLVGEYLQSGAMLRLQRPVSQQYEAAALLKKSRGELPLYFEHINGVSCPMVAGLGGTRQLIAHSMGIAPEEIVPRLASAIAAPLPVQTVQNAPVQQNVVTAPFSIDRYLPVLTHYEKDAGPFIISGMMVAKNMDGSKTYTSIRRMQYLGGNKTNLLVTSLEMKEQLARFAAAQEPMDIAVMFGLVPAVVLASQISTHTYNANKLEVAGALLGSPLEVTACKTVDLPVVANAEFVLEGRITPWIKSTEGPFGEMCSYYGRVLQIPQVEYTALTWRNNPIYQNFFPSGSEEKLPMAIAREVTLLATLRQTVPQTKQVHITLGGAGRLHAVVQICKTTEADGRQAALAAFASDKDLKHVVVVDEDVDIFNMEQVEWAIATRMQADRDLFIVGGAMGSPLEPSHLITGTSAKMGIDATCPLNDSNFITTHIPGEESIHLEDYIAASGNT